MPQQRVPLERKLTAILYADVAGYSRLTEVDEEGTHRRLAESLDHFTRAVERYDGRVGHYAGDAVLAEFPSVVLAVACALSVQRAVEHAQASVDEAARVRFRIGINLGDVIVDRGEIYGEGVNAAARLEALAEPGSVWVTDAVRRELGDRLPVECFDTGAHPVKNLSAPIRAFRVAVREGAELPVPATLVKVRRPRMALLAYTLVAVAAIALAGLYGWLGTPHRGLAPTVLEPPVGPSLAVLPFANLGGEPDQAYFADGITDDLITDLSKVPALFVIAANSSARYRGRDGDLGVVAEALGVRYVVKGSLRRTPSMVRLNAQLIDARSGEALWAERYDVDLPGIFALQDEIVRSIVEVLAVEPPGAPEPESPVLAAARPAVDIGAYDLFLRGWSHYVRETPEDYAAAIPLLEQAVAMDASFTRPHAVLAAIYYNGRLRRWFVDWGLTSHETFRRAYEHLRQASIEPSPLALSIGALMHIHNARHDAALEDAGRAVELDPNDPTAHAVLSYAHALSGQGEPAVEHAARAMRLDPHHPVSYDWTMGLARFVSGDYELARTHFERAGTDRAGLALTPLIATYGWLDLDEDAARVRAIQGERWAQWHPGHPLSLRALLADFPPFRDPDDAARLEEGLRRGLER